MTNILNQHSCYLGMGHCQVGATSTSVSSEEGPNGYADRSDIHIMLLVIVFNLQILVQDLKIFSFFFIWASLKEEVRTGIDIWTSGVWYGLKFYNDVSDTSPCFTSLWYHMLYITAQCFIAKTWPFSPSCYLKQELSSNSRHIYPPFRWHANIFSWLIHSVLLVQWR